MRDLQEICLQNASRPVETSDRFNIDPRRSVGFAQQFLAVPAMAQGTSDKESNAHN